jgi:CubicO group peptidase (beta-lactamase class C family)
MTRLSGLIVLVYGLAALPAASLSAQDVDVPRTRTLPGIASPAFPYALPEEVGLSSGKLERLAEEVLSWVAAGDLIGAELLIVKDGRAVFHEAYGWSDREGRKPVERNSIWSIKSMSKPFTAAAVLMLAEEGRLSLDDRVSRFIPGFAGDERTTIRHLLSHTSGYREEVGDPSIVHESFRDWVEDWARRTPTGTFGEYHYTDFGFAVAGYVVEEVSGLPIGAFTRQRIIEPLRLDDTTTEFSADSVWRERLNPWYRWNDDAAAYHLRWTRQRPAWRFNPAAWGMFSTAMDYASFMAMWLNRGERQGVRVLSPAGVEEALREQARGAWGAYGHGWRVEEEPRTNGMPAAFHHDGGDGTVAFAFPGANAIVVLLTHSRNGAHMGAILEAVGMLRLLDHPGLGLVWTDGQETRRAALTLEEQARYVGAYADREDDPRWVAHVRQEAGYLHLRVTRPGGRAASFWSHLVPLGGHRFAYGRHDEERVAVHPVWRVDFAVEGGRATAIRIVSGNHTLLSASRSDPDRILAAADARRMRASIADIVAETLEAEGIAAAQERFRSLLRAASDTVRIIEAELNAFGYRLLRDEGLVARAIAVFELNAEAFPGSPDAYDSLGYAYCVAGRMEEAMRSYDRAAEVAEQRADPGLPNYRARRDWIMRNLEKCTGP